MTITSENPFPVETKAPKTAGRLRLEETFEFLPFLSLRGAERRSNLMVYRMVMWDCFVGLWPPRNDKRRVFQRSLEGKEYVVRDGDIITFRFNV